MRLALIPVFLVVALSGEDGVGALAAVLFAAIGWGDYADGIAARVSGQYSRLGALMDPVTDRLLAICGRGRLLALRAAAALGSRGAGRARAGDAGARPLRPGARRGAARSTGRGGSRSAPLMGAFFFAMVGLEALGEVLLYVGLALALAASALYVRDGCGAAARHGAGVTVSSSA